MTALIIACVILSACLGLACWKLITLGKTVLALEEQIEESLDVIDVAYRNINSILEIPVMYDDPVVKQTLSYIRSARDSLLLIAHKLTQFSTFEEDDEEEEQS